MENLLEIWPKIKLKIRPKSVKIGMTKFDQKSDLLKCGKNLSISKGQNVN